MNPRTTEPNESELWRNSAGELAALIREGKVSSREVVDAHLERIDEVNGTINAVTVTLADSARQLADERDASRGDDTVDQGPFWGVPFTVKESIDVIGSATTRGVEIFADAIPSVDSPAVARMKAAGGVPLARTNLPEWGLRIDTDNPLRGRTHNPWQAGLSAGGSSGGEGAALATGMSPIGIGNDIGGSLRNPAFANGIVALKPTRGRVPRVMSLEPANPGLNGQLLSVEGPMARRISDLRMGLEVMAGRHAEDPMSVDATLAGPPVPRTAGLVTSVPGVELAPSVRAGIERAGAALAEAGWEVAEVEPPEMERIVMLWGSMMTQDIEASRELLETILSPGLVGMLGEFIELDEYAEVPGPTVHVERHRMGRAWSRFFVQHSVLVGPVWTQGIIEAGADIVPGSGILTTIQAIRFTIIGNLLGLPSCAVPTGLDDGLPTGVQVYADLWREDLTLAAGQAIESSLGALGPIDPKWSSAGS